MLTTKGFAAATATSPLAPFTFERREPRANDVLIDIKFCGVCHSDIHQARDEWGGSRFPMVPGHEIVGVVSRVGAAVQSFKVGDKVGVGCFVDSCRECAPCRAGLEQYCDQGMTPTYNGVERDRKTPTFGGYSTQITVDQAYVLRIPDQLDLARAAPLLCAGITTYSPLRHWRAGKGTQVAIVGLGGLGHMGVKLARAMGAEVTVLSQSPKKRADAERLGAHHYYATQDEETFKKLDSRFDLIINTVSAKIDWGKYLDLLKLDATMVLVGVPAEDPTLGAFPLIGKRRRLAGSLIGGIKETQEMLDFCATHDTPADIELIRMEQINEAYERMLRADVRYRFVIDLASMK
jgi:uncharacterized zinc-type alcohol dehydrogenase-like protein